MTPEVLSHVPVLMALGGLLVAIVIGVLKGWASLVEKIEAAIAAALKSHTDLEDVKWSEIERRLGRLEEKVDTLLMRHGDGQ